MRNLHAIVIDYIKWHRKRAEKELRWFAIQSTFSEAISLAAMAQSPSGKRLDHQRRIPQVVLEESRCRLQREIDRLKNAASFEGLFDIVESVIGNIKRIGELTVYDTALRIGEKLSLEPTHLFLHAGTKVGARKLHVGSSEKFIPINSLPQPLSVDLLKLAQFSGL
jgi:hypothetical protein